MVNDVCRGNVHAIGKVALRGHGNDVRARSDCACPRNVQERFKRVVVGLHLWVIAIDDHLRIVRGKTHDIAKIADVLNAVDAVVRIRQTAAA